MNIRHFLNFQRVRKARKDAPDTSKSLPVEGEMAILLLPDMYMTPLGVCWRLSL